MDRKWLPLNALRAFEAAGKHSSFTAAAVQLTVAQSAISRHVIVLERFLGVSLFERRPQQLVLTDAGLHLLPIVTRSLDKIDIALSEIIKERGQVRGRLKVALPQTFAHQFAVAMLRDFRAEHPGMTLEIDSSGSPNSDCDLAIVYSQPRVADAIFDLLWTTRVNLVCAPALAARADNLADLIGRNELLHIKLNNHPRHYLWERLRDALNLPQLNTARGLVFDTAQLAVQYARSGEGLALIDPVLFREDLATGTLVIPFPVTIADGFGYYLTMHREDLDNAAINLFRSWLIKRFCGEMQIL